MEPFGEAVGALLQDTFYRRLRVRFYGRLELRLFRRLYDRLEERVWARFHRDSYWQLSERLEKVMK